MGFLKSGIGITKGKLAFLCYNFLFLFISYFIIVSLGNICSGIGYRSVVIAALNLEICIAILIASFIIESIDKKKFGFISPTTIIALSVFLFLLNGTPRLMIVFAMVPVFSVSLLIFFQSFQDFTLTIERARISGIVLFITLPFVFMFEPLPVSIPIDFYFLVVINIAAIFFVFLKSKLGNNQASEKGEKTFEKRVMLLYLIPWIIFSMINVTLAKNDSFYIFQQSSSSFIMFLAVLQVVGVSIGAITIGFLADFVGRRISAAIVLTLYGVGSAFSGLFNSKWAFSLVYLISGVSWGSLFVLFLFVIWSDLANKENWAKMYALGLITYFASWGVSALVPQVFLSLETGSLVTCLISFFAIVPIFAVPELSSNDFIENMRIKRHIDSVKKLKNQG